jgi:hypothetical protein
MMRRPALGIVPGAAVLKPGWVQGDACLDSTKTAAGSVTAGARVCYAALLALCTLSSYPCLQCCTAHPARCARQEAGWQPARAPVHSPVPSALDGYGWR